MYDCLVQDVHMNHTKQQNTKQGRFCCQINDKSLNQTHFPQCFISVVPAYMLPTSVWVMIIMKHLEWWASAGS